MSGGLGILESSRELTTRKTAAMANTARQAWSSAQTDGYPALADFLAQDVDNETYVFRKFERLAARNILYLQGELIKLESDADALEREARDSLDPDVHLSLRSWVELDENARDPKREFEKKAREIADNVEVKLRKYCQYDHSSRTYR